MSVARFVTDHRTLHRVPAAKTCAWLGISPAWYYKWRDRPPTAAQLRRRELDAAVAAAFTAANGEHGSPRLVDDLREAGRRVSEKTVADSMRRQGLNARPRRSCRGLTRQDRTAAKFPDLLRRDFTADAPNLKWVEDVKEIRTEHGKVYLATVIDLFSRRLLGAATSRHPDGELCAAALRMAVAVREGPERIRGVIFHTDRGSTYTGRTVTALCTRWGIRQSMGRVGSCFDNAVAESFFSTLEFEVLRRHQLTDPDSAARLVVVWCYGFYNQTRRHSTIGNQRPAAFEAAFDLANVQPNAA